MQVDGYQNFKKKCIKENNINTVAPDYIFVTNDWSEARVDPLAALLIQRGGQTSKYQIVVSRAT